MASLRLFPILLAGSIAFRPLPGSAQSLSLEDLGFSKESSAASPQKQALMDKRAWMLKTHQRLGLITLAPMFAALGTGNGGSEGSASARNAHAALGMLAAAMYFTTAYFALAAPEVDEKPARGATRIHKILACIHFPAMVAAPVFGAVAYQQRRRGDSVHGVGKLHVPAAMLGTTAYTLAMISVTINF